MTPVPEHVEHLQKQILGWYAEHGRELPWRDHEEPWAVMMSEFMLQQTPVARVLPVFDVWIERWPTPADLAAAPSSEVLRAWGRLGYPRRALRLHEAARTIVTEHAGIVPSDPESLLALPGVGEYTAAAILSFAHDARAVVLDTNVRRLFARLITGVERPPAHLTRGEREMAGAMMPDHDAHVWAAATMELGALVCTARRPSCEVCPVSAHCAWLGAGSPPSDAPAPRAQSWHGTDRQCRGSLLAALRENTGPLRLVEFAEAWEDAEQRERCLGSLVADGLVSRTDKETYVLGTD